jgi:hypothetical protein
VKLDNVLMFESPRRWIAKISDFSHSLLLSEGSEEQYLPGGTVKFTAPEWKEKLPTAKLLKTDTYSYGILLGSVLGFDLVQEFIEKPEHGKTEQERVQYLQQQKQNDGFRAYVLDLLYDRIDGALVARREDLSLMQAFLECTLQADGEKRDLEKIITILSRYWLLPLCGVQP